MRVPEEIRKTAWQALQRYPLSIRAIRFLHHGENFTFRILADGGRQYLLRIHREGYHSAAAIREELAWLARLRRAGVAVPRPVSSRTGESLVAVRSGPVVRNCSLLVWTEGRLLTRGFGRGSLYRAGQLAARLHRFSGTRVTHRRYWHVAGLVGNVGTVGSYRKLRPILGRHWSDFERCRRELRRRLSRYQRRRPDRVGLIHADLHFGNIVWRNGKPIPIDFDDCGYGFHVYDLAVITHWGAETLRKRGIVDFAPFRETLLDGYRSRGELDAVDEAAIDDFVLARRMSLLAWLQTRSTVPRLAAYLRGVLPESLRVFRAALLR